MADDIPDQRLLCMKLYDFVSSKCPLNRLKLDILKNYLQTESTIVVYDPNDNSEDNINLKGANLFFIFDYINNEWKLDISIFSPNIILSILPQNIQIINSTQIKRKSIDDTERCMITNKKIVLVINIGTFSSYVPDIIIKRFVVMSEWITRNYSSVISKEVIRIKSLLTENTALVEKLDDIILDDTSKISNDLILLFTIDECLYIINLLTTTESIRYKIKRRLIK